MANNRRYRNKKVTKIDNYEPPFGEDVLAQSIDILNLRENTKTLLDGAHITTIKDIVRREDRDFYKISTFNKKNLFEVKYALKLKNLFLKPTPEVIPPVNSETSEGAKPLAAPNNNFRPPNNNRTQQGANNRQPQQDRRQNNHPNNNNRPQREFRGNEIPYVEATRIVRPPKPERETVKELPDIYVKVNRNGKWGFKDREGKQVVDPLYDEVFNFKDDLCCVQRDELFGFVNRCGEEVVPTVYNCATSFSEGLACVYKGEKCGYINTQNEIVIDFKFDAGTPVVNGECRVKKEGKWGELHINPPSEDTPDSVIPIALGVENIRWII